MASDDLPVETLYCFLCRSVLMVWKTLLEETDAVYKARVSISERLAAQVVEPVKSQRQNKSQLFKKVQPVMENSCRHECFDGV